MRRPRLLDLCCGGGGASAGYAAAGFDVAGADREDQPHYPFTFIRADALTVDLSGYDAIAASPPCQPWSIATPEDRRGDHPDILAPIRERLIASGVPYVIENVPGAPLIDPVLMCGETLRLGVRRHRLFESNVPILGTPCVHDSSAPAVPVYGSHGYPVIEARASMGIEWLPWDRLTQAVPPAYTYAIGVQLMAWIGSVRTGGVQVASVTDAVPDRTGLRRRSWVTADDLGVTNPRRREPVQTGTGSGDLEMTEGTWTVPVRTGVRRRSWVTNQDHPGVTNTPWTHTVGDARGPVDRRTCPRRGCGEPLIRPRTGRWPVWCSHACRQAGYRERHDAG